MSKNVQVQIGDEVVAHKDGQRFGAVREVHPHELVIDIENFGDVPFTKSAVGSETVAAMAVAGAAVSGSANAATRMTTSGPRSRVRGLRAVNRLMDKACLPHEVLLPPTASSPPGTRCIDLSAGV